MKNILILAAFMFILAGCGQNKEDQKNLKKEIIQMNLVVGETYTTRINAEMISYQDIDNSESQVFNSMNGTMTFTVLSEKDDVYEMEVRYTHLGMQMTSAYVNMEGDSDNPDPDNIFAMLMHNMMNKAFNIQMKKDGSITEIRNIDSLFVNLFDGLPEMDEATQAELTEQMKKAFVNDGLKGNLEQITAIYPPKPVAEDEKWEKTIQLEGTMKATQNITFRLKSADEKTFVIKGVGKMLIDKKNIVTVGDNRYQYDLDGDVKTSITIDRKTGWILSGTVTQEYSGDMYMFKDEFSKEKTKVPLTITTNIEYSNK